MWKCPKCGREFQKQNQEHYCTKPADIDEYIAFQEEGIQCNAALYRRRKKHFVFATPSLLTEFLNR